MAFRRSIQGITCRTARLHVVPPVSATTVAIVAPAVGYSGAGACSSRGQSRAFIYRTLEDVRAAGNVHEAATGTWESRRYTLREDNMGFSFHETHLRAGESTLIWYRNHVEAVLVFEGHGTIEVVTEDQKKGEGKVYELAPGTFYGLDKNERHFVCASEDGDMKVVCAFNPPIAGSEDHDEHGVYPAVGDDGVSLYHLEAQHLPELFKPPATLANGTKPLGTTKTAPPAVDFNPEEVVFHAPSRGMGKSMWEVANATTLDKNSPYAYMTFADHFGSECIVARASSAADAPVIGFVLGYRQKEAPETIFVWQVGVLPSAAGMGLGGRLLDAWARQCMDATKEEEDGKRVRFVEATVTPSNAASQALFLGFGRRWGASVDVRRNYWAQDDFPQPPVAQHSHESEDLYRIGPLAD